MNRIGILLGILLSATVMSTQAAQQADAGQQRALERARAIWNGLDRQHGSITLPNGVATLEVPERFYYLAPKDTKTVLVDVWGNPKESATGILGMLLPEGVTPFERESWGVTLRYEEDGYVSDEDADAIDYTALLEQMQQDTAQLSKQRQQQGYPPVRLLGWAEPPHYDKATHKLYWAKELVIGDDAAHTLNYNIRILGRKGVLVLNFIAAMEQKALIDAKLNTVLAMADFEQGSRYEDFDPNMDKVAAYGIGALIAGKAIAKTGLLAAALIFLKKFGLIFLAGLGAAFGRVFRKKSA